MKALVCGLTNTKIQQIEFANISPSYGDLSCLLEWPLGKDIPLSTFWPVGPYRVWSQVHSIRSIAYRTRTSDWLRIEDARRKEDRSHDILFQKDKPGMTIA